MKRPTRYFSQFTVILLLPFQSAIAYDCVEIFSFEVDRDNHSTKEYERAATTPYKILEQVQRFSVGEIIRSDNGIKAVNATHQSCPDDAMALQFGGAVTDFKAGNQSLRYWVGLGAGKQKLAIDAWLKDKLSGDVIYRDDIVDRKWGGVWGGDDTKGIRDFAQKVEGFIEKGLKDGKPK